MRKFTQNLAFLFLALLCAVGMPVQAETVTVHDGTSTNAYVPIYGFYADTSGKSQFVVSSDDLSDCANGSISGLTFYGNYDFTFTGTFEIRLMETSEAAVSSSFLDVSSATLVYSGQITIANGEASVAFSEDFAYSGDNLLVEVYLASIGSYSPSGSLSWYGVNSGTSRGGSGGSPSSQSFLPKVTFEYTPGSASSCERPTSIAVTEKSATSVSLTWVGGSGTYDVGIKGPGESDYDFEQRNTTATNHTFTGLLPNTSYSFAVKSKCAGEESGVRTVSATTALAIPFEENFDASSSLPTDWKQYTGLMVNVLAGTENLVSATYGWSMSTSTTGVFESYHPYTNIYGTSRKNWLVSPSIHIEENTRLSFMVALTDDSYSSSEPETNGTDDKFAVLVYSDASGAWTSLRLWDNAGSADVYNNIDPAGQEVVIDLSAYAGSNVQIAFYGESTSANADNYLHIDDVVVEHSLACSKPTGLHEVSGKATINSVQIAWDEDADAAAWKVQYKSASDIDWITVTANENPFEITGLEKYTEYSVRVAALCDASDPTTLTRYSKEISVKTAAGVPYHEGFNAYSLPSDWKRYEGLYQSVINGGDLTAVSAGWASVSKSSGNNVFDSAYHARLNIAGADCKNWIVSPTIFVADGYELSFDLALTTTSGGAVTAGEQPDDMFAVLVYADDEWNIVGQWTNTGAGNAFDEINSTTSGQKVKLNLSAYAGKGIQIAFYGESTEANGNNNLHISNVSIDLIPACEPALSLSFDNVDVTTASANWTAQVTDGAWAYGYVANPDEDFAPAATDYIDTIAAMDLAMTGLTGNTTYAFFVRNICDEEASEVLIQRFKTLPAPIAVPWTETFESMDADEVPENWDNSASTSQEISSSPYYIWGVYSTSSNKMIRMHNWGVHTGVALINTPRIELPGDKACILSFNYSHTASCGNFTVKISVNDGATWTEIGSYGNTTTGTSYSDPGEFASAEINLTAYMGQIVRLQFFANANYGDGAIFVDNVSIQEAPDCIKPGGLDVYEIQAEGALVSWNNDNFDGTGWVYACLPADEEAPEGAAMIPVAVNSLNLTGLTEKTDYVFYLRKVCGESFSEGISAPFKTLAKPMAMPFIEDFNDLTSGIPEFWNNEEGTMTTASYRWNYTASGYAGAGLVLNSYTPSSGQYSVLATPQIILSEPAMLSFMWKNPAGGAGEVFIAATDGQRVSLKNNLTGISAWEKVDLNLSDYTGDTVVIFFKGTSNCGYNDAYLYLDDVKVEALPSCLKPLALAPVAESVTTNSVQLDWNPQGSESAWLVQYKKSAAEEWSFCPDSVLVHPFILGGLEPATSYDVRVAAWCDLSDTISDVSEYSAAISFITECEVISTFPYSENFDGMSAAAHSYGTPSERVLPVCWNAINSSTYSSYKNYPTVFYYSSYPGYANTPANALRFYSYYSSYSNYDPQDQYAVLPQMEGISGLRIKLNARKYAASYEGKALIGVMSDPADASTFELIQTLAPAGEAYESFVVPFAGYAGEGKYIAIKMEAATSSVTTRGFFIDDIVVEVIPNCLEVTALAVIDSTITTTSANVKWHAQGSESAWLVQYKKHADSEWISAPEANDTIASLENLEAATKYDVRVAAKCSETEVSPFTDSISFVTACDTWSIETQGDYNEDFEAYEGTTYGAAGEMPICWDAYIASGATVLPHVILKGGSYAYIHEGEKALTFHGKDSCYAALPVFAEPINTLRINFWSAMESASNGKLMLGYVTEAQPTVFHEIASYSSSYQTMASHQTDLNNVPAEAARLVFCWYYSGQYSCCIDDIKVSLIPNCLNPAALAVLDTTITTNSAEIRWTAQNEETAWSVQYRIQGAEEWNTVVAANDTFKLESLQGSSIYEVRVAAKCGETELSEYTQPITFTTACDVVTVFPYEQNFDGITGSTTEHVLPICWNYINTTTYSSYQIYPSVYNSSSYVNSTPNALRFYSYYSSYTNYDPQDQYAILPQMEDVNGLRMKFNARAYSASSSYMTYDAAFTVGVMTDPSDASTFVPVKTFNPASTTYEPFVVAFNTYAGEGKYIAIKMAAAASGIDARGFFIDDVRIEELPNCLEPEDVAVAYNGADSVVVSWTSNATAWNIDLNGTLIPVAENPYTIHGLDMGTAYTVKVQSVCGEEVSEWSNEAEFATDACLPEDQMTYSYTLTDSYGDGWNGGATLNVVHVASSANVASLTLSSGYSLEGTFKLCCGEQYKFVWGAGSYDYECSFVIKDMNGATVLSQSDPDEGDLLTHTVVCPSCFKPTNLVISDIMPDAASVQWTPGKSNQTAWQIAFDTLSSNQPDTLPTFADVTVSAYAMVNLLPEHNYHVYVRANCGEDDFSEWAHVSFRTASLCQNPDDVHAENITVNSAAIHWSTYGQATFNLRYSVDGTNWIDSLGVAMPLVINGLNANTSYSVKVQATCKEEADEWSAAINFRTDCGVEAIPFSENFDSSIDCWKMVDTHSSTGLSTDAKYNSSVKGFSFHYNTAPPQYLISPELEDINAALEIEFMYKNASTTWAETFHVGYSTTSNDPSAFTWGDEISASSGVWTSYEGALPAGTKYVAIKYTANNKYYLYIDNLRITRATSCAKPTDFAVGDVFAHTAKLSWTAGSEDQTAWQIALDTIAAFNPDTLSNLIAADDTVHILANLDPETTYYVYVRANCGEEVSKWSARQSFRTTVACPAPTGLEAQLTPGNGSIATLTWNAGDANAWILEYCINGNWADSIAVEASTASVDLTGLTAEATYYARVKADCGEEDGQSAYSAVITFIPTDKYELTINDGTATNAYVPVYGSYVDEGSRSQFIIPAAQLVELEWDSITSLTFYGSFTSTSKTTWGDAEFDVYVAEAPEATMSALVEWSSMDKVLASAKLALVNDQMVVTFAEPYQYQGGNLMIGIYQTVNGSWANVNWLGVTATGASFGGYSNSVSQRNFLPKMTITYLPGQEPACKDPKHLVKGAVTAHTAAFSWDAVEGQQWLYAALPASADPAEGDFHQIAENSILVEGLNELTDYVFYLRAACAEEYNKTLSIAFTTDAHIESVPFAEDFEGASAWKLINGSEANAWTIGNATSFAGDKALYISDNAAAYQYETEAQATVFASILLNFAEDTTYIFEYEWKCEGEFNDEDGALDFLRVALVPGDEELVAGAAVNYSVSLPANWIALDGGVALHGENQWQHINQEQALLAGQYKLVFVWHNDDADSDGDPAAIDNIGITIKPGDTTGFGNIGTDTKAVKFIRGNHVYILVNGVIYDATGRRVE